VWGADATTPIDTPGLIDDYNHWMRGIDKADQLIASYQSSLRCMRVWMPIMLHCLDIIRVNSYVVAKSKHNIGHKEFVIDLIFALNERADCIERGDTRRTPASTFTSPPGSEKKQKRRRMSNTHPDLPICRLQGNRKDHKMIITTPIQKTCIYCSYLASKAKLDGAAAGKLKKPARMCSSCGVHVCNAHWEVFHGWS
jgi:hypothetical protein